MVAGNSATPTKGVTNALSSNNWFTGHTAESVNQSCYYCYYICYYYYYYYYYYY